MDRTIGFVGLGSMGLPMAKNLLEKGYQVHVFNRTPGRAEALASWGAKVARSIKELAEAEDLVITMLSDDRALEEVVLAKGGLLDGFAPGSLHLSMSTIAPATSAELARRHAERGVDYVSAPVFGRPDAAAARKLWICQSGPARGKEKAKPVLESLGQGVFDFGDDPAAAHVVKLCGNFLIASAIEAMAEAYTLAEKSGLRREAVASLFAETLFACPIYANYGKQVAAQSYEQVGFRLALGLKDMNLVQRTAVEKQVPMPFAAVLQHRLLTAMAKGRTELDWTAFALGASEDAGVK